ncbi:AP-2 complex subunit alpha-1 [Tetrabaena socialis]|uniref:AP-2 complex subunit alpha-1 n=1 Tax=Tetrabaena socialis TaxID=47790 RepID=A0A2J7ZZV9_9CHLO|nr:AP-2 complex subunit alpha-1 [Tetrabaena socialis]|eukprot:PNH05778.1 AP-2 complex subunit alpha-1 [Tetrabaena socialis]
MAGRASHSCSCADLAPPEPPAPGLWRGDTPAAATSDSERLEASGECGSEVQEADRPTSLRMAEMWTERSDSAYLSAAKLLTVCMVFISDIRSCQNKEQEQRRVEKELAKIRARFGEDKALSGKSGRQAHDPPSRLLPPAGYDRRKYIWKLLYIYMLGFDIDFGHKQACDLIPMPKYSDKQVGYMACSLLLQENDEFLRLAINAIHLDLTSRNEAFQALGLSFVGNIGGHEMAEALTLDVLKLLTSGASRPLIKKRATLCLLRLLRKTPADAPLLVTADTFSPTMGALLDERDLGLLLCSVTLLHGLVSRSGTGGYETCQGRVIKVLERLVRERERIPPEYLYYGIPSPWLQARCLRALQLFPPPDSAAERKSLHDVLQNIIAQTSAEAAKNANPNKTNALNAILFEALAVALHHASATNNAIAATGPDAANDRATLGSCLSLMGRYLAGKDPNAKYLALDSLARLAGGMPEVLEGVRHHQATVMASLKDPDVSIRRRALDLLFSMCDSASAPEVVGELLKHLVVADFGVREELVLKLRRSR